MVIMESLILHGPELSCSVVLLPLFILILKLDLLLCFITIIYSKLVQYPVAGEKQFVFYITMVFNCMHMNAIFCIRSLIYIIPLLPH